MKRRPIAPFFLLLLAAVGTQRIDASSRQSGSVQVTTRLVKLFGGLEREWMDAVRTKDEAAAGRLMADDFELRTADAPGRPVAKAEWLRSALAMNFVSLSIRDVSARDVGSAVVVSFQLSQQTTGSSDSTGEFFIVDTWVQAEGSWKVAARHAARAETRPLPIVGNPIGIGAA